MSISRSSTSVTGSPAPACIRSPSRVTMRLTAASDAGGGVVDQVAPANLSGRDGAGIAAEQVVRPVDVLHRHAERSDAAWSPPDRPVPVLAAGSVRGTTACADWSPITLSPSRAQTGIAVTAEKLNCPRSAAKGVGDRLEHRTGRNSTRSILLIASTTWRTPSSEAMAAWRRVCDSRPLRASTSRMARSAVEAPVTMLRVYCWWPGRIGQDEAAAPASRRSGRRRRW